MSQRGSDVDGTLGGGGHARGICERLGEKGTLIGIDRDKDALSAAEERLKPYPCRKFFIQSNYADIRRVLDQLGVYEINGALLDLGVSSFQLDNEARGFSYMKDAPLDMRMSQDDSFTAAQVVNTYSEQELTEVIRNYGEERWASRISKFIVQRRKGQASGNNRRAGRNHKSGNSRVSQTQRAASGETHVSGDPP